MQLQSTTSSNTSSKLYIHEWFAVVAILGLLFLLMAITFQSRFHEKEIEFTPQKNVSQSNVRTVSKRRIPKTKRNAVPKKSTPKQAKNKRKTTPKKGFEGEGIPKNSVN